MHSFLALTNTDLNDFADACQVVSTTDPLVDSDEEMLDDTEHVRHDYSALFNLLLCLRSN